MECMIHRGKILHASSFFRESMENVRRCADIQYNRKLIIEYDSSVVLKQPEASIIAGYDVGLARRGNFGNFVITLFERVSTGVAKFDTSPRIRT